MGRVWVVGAKPQEKTAGTKTGGDSAESDPGEGEGADAPGFGWIVCWLVGFIGGENVGAFISAGPLAVL